MPRSAWNVIESKDRRNWNRSKTSWGSAIKLSKLSSISRILWLTAWTKMLATLCIPRIPKMETRAKRHKVLTMSTIRGTPRAEVTCQRFRHAQRSLATCPREAISIRSTIWMLSCYSLIWNSLTRTLRSKYSWKTPSLNCITRGLMRESGERSLWLSVDYSTLNERRNTRERGRKKSGKLLIPWRSLLDLTLRKIIKDLYRTWSRNDYWEKLSSRWNSSGPRDWPVWTRLKDTSTRRGRAPATDSLNGRIEVQDLRILDRLSDCSRTPNTFSDIRTRNWLSMDHP